ncbi:MAG: FxLYD domain-containing protein, partial [Clostridiales bacterium]|nr:FxLYD domain-containing protein [Clostridiales bacterium]
VVVSSGEEAALILSGTSEVMDGQLTIHAQLYNRSSAELSNVTLVAGVYDADGRMLGLKIGSGMDLVETEIREQDFVFDDLDVDKAYEWKLFTVGGNSPLTDAAAGGLIVPDEE